MELKNIFKLTALSTALAATLGLAGCGGDIHYQCG